MRWAAIVIALGASGCDLVYGLHRTEGWLDDYRFRKPITITSNAVEDLTDVPISVVVDSDADLVAEAAGDGADLVFATEDDDIIERELVAYDPATGAVEAWVTLPSMRAQSATQFFLYYSGPARSASASAAWPGDAQLVLHMDGMTEMERDSTSNARNASGPLAPASVTGIVGAAREITPSISLSVPSSGLDFGTGSFSYSIWVNVADAMTANDSPFYKGGSGDTNEGYCLLLGNGDWQAELGNGRAAPLVIAVAPNPTIGRWIHLGAVVDREAATFRVYRDGAAGNTLPIPEGFGSADDAQKPLELGSSNYPYLGGLDEVRVFSGALPAARFAIEYANLADRSHFMQIGEEETR